MQVTNKFPTVESSYRLAIIGEVPGKDEDKLGEPFVGTSGRFLAALLSKAGISKSQCFFGSVSQYMPPIGKTEKLDWTGYEIQDGLAELKKDLDVFKPNILVLCGNLALKAAKDFETNHPLIPKRFRYKTGNWRGSLFRAVSGPFAGYKCMATYNPAYVLRDYTAAPLLLFDLKRAVKESAYPELNIPQRMFRTDLSMQAILDCFDEIRKNRLTCAIDIEGGVDSMSCISFATASNIAFILPFLKKDGTAYWQPDHEIILLKAMAAVLEDENVPKVLQNCLYDTFVLKWSYHINVRNVQDDTMLKHWEYYAELEKNLGLQTSIYTLQPYYKGDRKSQDDKTFYEYCCMDSAVTFEINDYLEFLPKGGKVDTTSARYNELKSSKEHYDLNMSLLLPIRYMEHRGIRYDAAKAKERRELLQRKMFELQAQLNAMAGYGFPWKAKQEIVDHCRNLMGFKKLKRSWDMGEDQVKKEYIPTIRRVKELLQWKRPDLATMGELEDLCEVSLNTGSTPTMCKFFYETLSLPPQYNDDKENPGLTTNYEALLNLSHHCQKSKRDREFEIIKLVIDIKSLDTRQRMLGIFADSDGRIRCGYNIVGSETGRITCYTSPTGSGYNLQTIPKYKNPAEAPGGVIGDRDLFVADPDHWFFECDLEGADSWTVAAYCAMLGDPTMLDDLQAGVRPAKRICLYLRGVEIDYRNREAVLEACEKVSKDSWDYFACKRVVHGASYLEGPRTIGRNILTDSEGKLFMEERECKKLRDVFMMAYPGIPKWHQWWGRQLARSQTFTMATGQVRRFLGRPEEILTKAVAAEPQAVTTYVTNSAMWQLWNDPANRYIGEDGRVHLHIEPLHQVHDALIGQFHKSKTEWAVKNRIPKYFNNPIRIAGRTLTIPFEGGYGESWLKQNGGKIVPIH